MGFGVFRTPPELGGFGVGIPLEKKMIFCIFFVSFRAHGFCLVVFYFFLRN
jgi:hypothetical protein